MIKQVRVRILAIFGLLCTLFLGGCGLPDSLQKQAEGLPQAFKGAKEDISAYLQKYESRKDSQDWGFLQSYAERENLVSKFGEAEAALAHAQSVFDTEVKPIMKRNKKEDAEKLIQQFRRITTSLSSARTLAREPEQRLQFLLEARAKAPAWVDQAVKDHAEVERLLGVVEAVAVKAQTDYPSKKEDIGNRFASLAKIVSESADALRTAKKELQKTERADYALLGDSTRVVTARLESIRKLEPEARAKFSELYRSYAKTLIDMRADYYVEIGRTSWDEAYDFPTEHEHVYRVQVDERVNDYFDSLGDNAVATHNKGWLGGTNVSIETAMWQALNIDLEASWPSGDDSAEFWVRDAYVKTYHRYLVVENGQKTETGWEEVDTTFFDQHEDDLGLTLVSKPYGMYEEETVKQAAPVGMEYVAKPVMENGNPTGGNQYGHWDGGFWHFYGQYSFIRDLLGGRTYSYDDWHAYDRRDRSGSYYGRDDQWGTYGNATYGSGRYKNTDYVRRNPGVINESKREGVSAHNNQASSSVRNAGPSDRARGPGGGGK